MAGDPEEYEAARCWIDRQFGGAFQLEEMVAVGSRLARLHRVTLAGPGGQRRRAYLKHDPAEAGARLRARLSDMAAAAAAVDGTPGLMPFTVLASDADQGLLLLAELPGRPLTDWHWRAMLSPSAAGVAERAWYGAGRWLGRLHGAARPPVESSTRAAEVAGEIRDRLDLWEAADPNRPALIAGVRTGVQRALDRLGGRPVLVVLCHGDITPGNMVLEGSDVGLLDLDDLRLDMPALDLSQARLAIDEFGHPGWPIGPLRARAAGWQQAFVSGYGRPLPEGPAFWLPHLRNLVVYLLTLARQRVGISPRRVALELRYHRLMRELDRTLTDVAHGRESWKPAG